MLGFLVMLLVAAIIGFIGDALVPGTMPGGWVGAILAGILGSALGGYLFGMGGLPSGPVITGLAIIPSIVGAAIVVWLVSWASGQLSGSNRY
ncbi:MAG TPA: GlsB/YeaQ/YmgE family stress response membrane protein [Cyanobacteria bacterium UBA8530]|nr:GlsB/YeaQ/YmgE family stress response membrane protein [Cyanobacteria bacterium UBA8530]